MEVYEYILLVAGGIIVAFVILGILYVLKAAERGGLTIPFRRGRTTGTSETGGYDDIPDDRADVAAKEIGDYADNLSPVTKRNRNEDLV